MWALLLLLGLQAFINVSEQMNEILIIDFYTLLNALTWPDKTPHIQGEKKTKTWAEYSRYIIKQQKLDKKYRNRVEINI